MSIGCTIIYYILNFLKQKRKDLISFEIKNLEARMASLRMILKAKVKKKSQHFRTTAAGTIKQGDTVDLAIVELAELQFETNEQFEKYFSISKQLNTYLKIDHSKSANTVSEPPPIAETLPGNSPLTSDFMTTDVKNEFIIIKTIHEMINLSLSLKAKIDHFNLTNLTQPLPEAKIIQFPSVMDVQKIFSSQETSPESEKIAA